VTLVFRALLVACSAAFVACLAYYAINHAKYAEVSIDDYRALLESDDGIQ
jgi:hypothetical protein